MTATQLCESALSACRQYENAATEIARLTKEIGDALMECPTLDPEEGIAGVGPMPGQWTHLKAVYKVIVPTGPEDARRIGSDEATRILAGDDPMPSDEVPGLPGDPPSDMECPHCLKAHRAIQERKSARQRMGAAKRFIRSVGKRSLKETRA